MLAGVRNDARAALPAIGGERTGPAARHPANDNRSEPGCAGSVPSGGRCARTSEEPLRKAATDFEALLIAQLLKSMRESGEGCGWLGASDDASSDSLLGLAEQQVAQVLASQGGIGLSKLVAQGLKQG